MRLRHVCHAAVTHVKEVAGHCDRTPCRAHAEWHSWRAATHQFLALQQSLRRAPAAEPTPREAI